MNLANFIRYAKTKEHFGERFEKWKECRKSANLRHSDAWDNAIVSEPAPEVK